MASMPTGQVQAPDRAGAVTTIYILYLVGLVIGITTLVGVIMAYVNRSGAPEWAQAHYQLQIRTFWIGLLYGVIGFVLCFIIVGWFVLLFGLVWYIVRCAKGLKYASNGEPYPKPTTWMW